MWGEHSFACARAMCKRVNDKKKDAPAAAAAAAAAAAVWAAAAVASLSAEEHSAHSFRAATVVVSLPSQTVVACC